MAAHHKALTTKTQTLSRDLSFHAKAQTRSKRRKEKWYFSLRRCSFASLRETLLSLPADSVLRVFENDAAAEEFIADFVGATEVAAPACFLAFVNQ